MHEKAKSKGPEISWAYRLSKMLHILKRDEIEVTATPEQCLQHLEKMYTKDTSMHPFEVEVINNYKVYDVVVRSVDRSPKGGEMSFILCRLQGKGDKTIVSLEVSIGQKIFLNFLVGVFLFPFLITLFGFFSGLSIAYRTDCFAFVPFLLIALTVLSFLIFTLWSYPAAVQDRNEMLAHVVGYMFRIEEKLASQHPLDVFSTHQSTHPVADFESHADPDQAASGRYH